MQSGLSPETNVHMNLFTVVSHRIQPLYMLLFHSSDICDYTQVQNCPKDSHSNPPPIPNSAGWMTIEKQDASVLCSNSLSERLEGRLWTCPMNKSKLCEQSGLFLYSYITMEGFWRMIHGEPSIPSKVWTTNCNSLMATVLHWFTSSTNLIWEVSGLAWNTAYPLQTSEHTQQLAVPECKGQLPPITSMLQYQSAFGKI